MTELFQTYTMDGAPQALVPRDEVHRLGLWHRAANVLLFRSGGRLVLQQRAAIKDICPNLWDLSVAEHLMPDETYIEAAQRGLHEELGLSGLNLKPLGGEITCKLDDPVRGIKDYEFQQCFTTTSDHEIQFDPAEVSAIEFWTLSDIGAQLIENPAIFTPWLKHILEQIDLSQA